jgi:hypothetical protein
MSRVKFKKSLQRKFLNGVKGGLKVNWLELAGILEVDRRGLSNWKREVHTYQKVYLKSV